MELFAYIPSELIYKIVRKINDFKITQVIFNNQFIDEIIHGKSIEQEDEEELCKEDKAKKEQTDSTPNAKITTNTNVNNTTDVKDSIAELNDQSMNKDDAALEMKRMGIIQQLRKPE